MLKFQPWKTWTVIIICLFGVLLAVPNALPPGVIAALPSWVPAHKVNLGLDLQGGSYLLYEVDMAAVAKDRMEGTLEGIRTELLKAKIGYTTLAVEGDHIALAVRDPADLDRVSPLLHQMDPDLQPPQAANGVLSIARPMISGVSLPASDMTVSLRVQAIRWRNMKYVRSR